MSDVTVNITEDTVTVGVPGAGYELVPNGTYRSDTAPVWVRGLGVIAPASTTRIGNDDVALLAQGESCIGTAFLPESWMTYDAYAWVANAGSTAGDFKLTFRERGIGDGEQFNASGDVQPEVTASVTTTAHVMERVQVASGVTGPSDGEFLSFRITRGSTGDTLGGTDAEILAVEFRKAS